MLDLSIQAVRLSRTKHSPFCQKVVLASVWKYQRLVSQYIISMRVLPLSLFVAIWLNSMRSSKRNCGEPVTTFY